MIPRSLRDERQTIIVVGKIAFVGNFKNPTGVTTMKIKNSTILFAIFLGLCPAQAEVKLNALFSANAVLQRDSAVPVWGTADPGEKITVEFAGQTKSTAADDKGSWKVLLDPMPASSENRILTVKGEKTASPLQANNILVGDVWLCSGQSNMERELGLRKGQQPLINWEEEASSANYPLLRHLIVKNGPSDTPVSELNASWQVCSPETAPTFTAVGYYFGRDLHKHLGVPIGLINSTVGGTPSDAWTSLEILESGFPEVIANHEKAIAGYPEAVERFRKEEPELLAKWEKDAEEARKNGKPEPRKPSPPRDPKTSAMRPASLFNGKIAPLIPSAIKGVIWYQGESNNSRAKQYRTLFPALIKDWRTRWEQPQLPFLFVQIAPFKNMSPEIREAQLIAWQSTPATSMVVTTDVGDADDIHPTRKEPVGVRLALAARAKVYGEDIVYSGPVFSGMQVEGDQAILQFDHIGSGLVAKDGPLRGFTISGDGMTFVPAEAEIAGNTVKVKANGIAAPKSVRYGWTNVPDVNLFNAEGLPASPFRTDVEQ